MMLSHQRMRRIDIFSSFTSPTVPSPPMNSSPRMLRTPRRAVRPVTCIRSATEVVDIDSFETSTHPPPISALVVENTIDNSVTVEEDPEHDQQNSGHSMKSRECLVLRPQPLEGDAYFSLISREGPCGEAIDSVTPAEAASCPPQSDMLRHGGEEVDDVETRQDAIYMPTETHNSSTALNKAVLVWDIVRDNDYLRSFYQNRWNLVLDSVAPDRIPHIVITPIEENFNDQYIAWQNRVDSQWPGNLMVPRLSLMIGRIPSSKDSLYPGHQPTSISVPLDNYAASLEMSKPAPVFNALKFRQFIQSTSVERVTLAQIIRTLQKQKCRAAFFEACTKALSFRERYDALPDIFSPLEPKIVWTDPGEVILNESRRHFRTLILDSACPFIAPHIIISEPWTPGAADNATPCPQDCKHGQLLTVSSNMVQFVNSLEDDWDYVSAAAYGTPSDLDEDYPEGSSRPGTPCPCTPVDDSDDALELYFERHGDGHDGREVSYDYPSILGFGSVPEFEDHMSAAKLSPTTRPIFTIDDDEDDLPPFDDWYK